MWYHIRPTWCGLRHNFWFENYTGTFRRQKRPWAKLWNSVQIYCYICAKALLYLHKDTDVFVQIYFYICANILLYLCRMQSIKKWVLAVRPSVSSHSGKPSLLPWHNLLILIYIIKLRLHLGTMLLLICVMILIWYLMLITPAMAQPSQYDLHHHLVLPHHDYPPPPLLSSVSSAMIIVIITPHLLPHKVRNCDICLILDSRQKRVLPLVKYAPSNSCVPPAMAAVAVRILDRAHCRQIFYAEKI